MSAQLIGRRGENIAKAEAGSSLSIGLDDVSPAASWSLLIWADLPDLRGPRFLGRIVTVPAAGLPRSRVVGIAVCPGAVGWRVDARLIAGPADADARLMLAPDECCSAAPGVHPIDPDPAPSDAIFSVSSSAVESLIQIPGATLWRAHVTNTAAALRYLQLHNSAAAPVNNATPVYFRAVAAGATEEFLHPRGRVFALGIWAALSTTGPTLTLAADGWFGAESS